LTLDRRIRGILTKEWSLGHIEDGIPLLEDQVICEFKYQASLPALFKELIGAMCLSPSPVSKYRSFLRALGYGQDRRTIDA
jgi:hypothetical protein